MTGEEQKAKFLDSEAAQAWIMQRLQTMTEESRYALFLIDLGQTEVQPGETKPEGVEEQIRTVFGSLTGAIDLISQIGREEFIVFVSGQVQEKDVVQAAETLCKKEPGESKVQMDACVGAYFAYENKISFEQLFCQAAIALYEAKKKGSGGYYILTSRRPGRELGEEMAGISMRTLLEHMDNGVALLEVGAEIRILYASGGLCRMLGRKAIPTPCGLEELGLHPDYAKDYEAELRDGAEKEEGIDHVHRIVGNGSSWIWRHVYAIRVSYPGSKNPVMLELSIDVSELIKTERQLRINNERLRVAFHQMPHLLWEVNIAERTFNIYNVDEEGCQTETEVADFPESFLKQKVVHPDSADDFRMFAGKLLEGRAAGKGNFRMRERADRPYSWVALSYHMTYDELGRPLKAVGVQEKLPELPGIWGDVVRRRPLPENVRRHLMIRMKANLTRDSVEELWKNGLDQTGWTWRKTYSQIIGEEEAQLFAQSDKQEFQERFQRERLLKDYERGEIWSSREYQRVDEAGNITWFIDVVNLVKDGNTGDICMYVCFLESQLRHDWEQLAGEKILRDAVSGLYTVETAKAISEALLGKELETQEECALSLIRLMGNEISRDNQRFTAAIFSMALGMDCVIGQYSPDIILVFVPRAVSRFEVKRRIEDAFAYFRMSMRDNPAAESMRLVAGTTTCPAREAEYDVMVMQAAFLSDQGKDVAVDTVLFPVKDADWTWTGLYQEVDENAGQVDSNESERQLTREEQAAAFRCVTEMLSARSLENSLTEVLRELGQFYHAARTYILKVSEERGSVDMVYEWASRGKQSLRHIMQEARLDRIPLLRNCYQKKEPVMMDSPKVLSRPGSPDERWNFAAYPLKQKDEVTGFLCVEDAKAHVGDMALLRTLVPYLSEEGKRFQTAADEEGLKGKDALTSFPNLSSYMDVVYSMDSETYSSMGVLALDVPNYSEINSSYGFKYGKKMMNYIADMLVGVFGQTNIFRTWDSEFVVLFPNTIKEVFTGRCTRLRTQIQRRYPRMVQIGYVWAEGVFSAKQMVKEAQMIMRGEDVKAPMVEKGDFLGAYHPHKEVSKKNFVPYFQPKVDMRDGSVVGAEALVRQIREDGTVLQPGGFIEEMEENGAIRELDLLMFEMILQQLCEWKAKKYPLLPVSVNMSRVTLFNPSTFASILAIQSRYPQIPTDQVELEITETAGDVEKSTLAEVIDRFGQCGIRFELDDFGAGYSNLAMFSNYKFHTVKLDRTLVNDLPDNQIGSMMVENITQICEKSGRQCIAEGIETRQQAEELKKVGCIYGQGFYYAKPMPADEFEKKYLEHAS